MDAVSGTRVPLLAWWPRRRWRLVLQVPSADEVPDRLPRRGMVVVARDSGVPSWAVFDCPCRTGHRLVINLSHHRQPHWTLSGPSNKPSLAPSVNALTNGRRCHFWVRHGKIHPAADSDPVRS